MPMIDYFLKMWPYMARTEVVVVVITAGILLACVLLFLVSVSRRLYNARKYRVLDSMRMEYLPMLREIAIVDQYSEKDLLRFKASPESAKWNAIEDVLFALLDENSGDSAIIMLFEKLGYLDFYREMLDSTNVITQASVVTKLGMLTDRYSAKKLLELFKKENVDINAAAIRAFCKIGEEDLVPRFLAMLSDMLNKRLVSTKTIDTSLALLAPGMIPVLLKFARTCDDPRVVASILKVLGSIPPDAQIYDFAVSSFNHRDPEVRAKASKVVANFEITHGICNHEAWPKLLCDPVWFVRLQAVRVMGKQQCSNLVDSVSELLVDKKWQVRNAAVEALINLGEEAVNILQVALRSTDQYAKESICEVMQRTGFVERLLNWLDEGETVYVANIYDIFSVMVSLGFTSHLKGYAHRAEGRGHGPVIEKMLSEEAL